MIYRKQLYNTYLNNIKLNYVLTKKLNYVLKYLNIYMFI